MAWSVGALASVRAAAQMPCTAVYTSRWIQPVRMLSSTPLVAKKSAPGRGKARKSPKTLLRLYAEGKLKGAEAARAVAILEDQSIGAAPVQEEAAAPTERSLDALTLSEARHIIRVRRV